MYLERKGIRYFTVYTATTNQGAVHFYARNGMTALYTTFIGQATSRQGTAGDINREEET